ncbi:hypothetical protein TrVE_jg7043 [Triparma verrucosa]|uniref:RNA polymerase sigma-70 domain-containing protein n=2 Tax=Triparma TaxID=722752 RepID=A0A9W7BND9_9STRA|nr:hypothetical protein TrVE_jg7043 [Triparma verrucosa]GMH90787.1 hypothetical protein TrST_g5481 [Triparma strigata]
MIRLNRFLAILFIILASIDAFSQTTPGFNVQNNQRSPRSSSSPHPQTSPPPAAASHAKRTMRSVHHVPAVASNVNKSTRNKAMGTGGRRKKEEGKDWNMEQIDKNSVTYPKNSGTQRAQKQKADGYYQHAKLLSASEEISLGTQVAALVKLNDIYWALTSTNTSSVSIHDWALASGYWDPPSSSTSSPPPPPFPPSRLLLLLPKRHQTYTGRDVVTPTPVESPLPPSPVPHLGTFTDFVNIVESGKHARKKMVESNMRLVISIARRYSSFGVSQADLVQEGSLGLMRATEKYDPTKGFKFSTYSSWWIQQSVFLAIAYQSRTIRLPVHVHNLLNKSRKTKASLLIELGRTPTVTEIASRLSIPEEKLRKVISMTKNTVSLEAPTLKAGGGKNSDRGELALVDTLSASEHSDDWSEASVSVDRSLFRKDLLKMMTVLSESEAMIIRLRYGVDDGKFRTVAEVSDALRKSKAWVRSQEVRGLRKLRRPWYEEKLREYAEAFADDEES